MRHLVTNSQMKALDGRTIFVKGVPSMVLMERAALAVTEEMEKKLRREEKILVICGSGNNGGDGMAIARLLHLKGYHVRIYHPELGSKISEETARQQRIAENYGVSFENNPQMDEYTTIVDALLGIGLSREIRGDYASLIEEVNASGAYVWAVDIPSGIRGDTGAVMGHAIRARETVTFAYGKPGCFLYPGAAFCGKVHVKDIGIYGEEEEFTLHALEEGDLGRLLPRRVSWGNKGTFGKVLTVAGDRGMAGAAYLSAKAALYGGAGMVKIHTVEANREILQQLIPEALFYGEEETGERKEEWEQNLSWADVLVMGPGLGQGEGAYEKLLYYLSRWEKPLVLDADGLNLLASHPKLWEYAKASWILTPHMGEFARLVGKSVGQVKEDPLGYARELATRRGVVCVLKDAVTVTATPGGEVYLNTSGNEGMATAGSGDVLSGILGGLLAQNPDCSGMAPLGVYLHGLAGDEAALIGGRRSLIASDLLEGLCEVLRKAE